MKSDFSSMSAIESRTEPTAATNHILLEFLDNSGDFYDRIFH
ncbi:hypothetical protein [Chamaesiphon sp. OTE_75_metabat_556]|nr:hypothetical protein [Chamaesiphon sp. OTE_75_metabat_556]